MLRERRKQKSRRSQASQALSSSRECDANDESELKESIGELKKERERVKIHSNILFTYNAASTTQERC